MVSDGERGKEGESEELQRDSDGERREVGESEELRSCLFVRR
jgi:hypothetical protein